MTMIRIVPLFIVLVAIGTLAAALTAEHVFKLHFRRRARRLLDDVLL